ncbi:MAG: hypothetical protein ACK4PI_05680 [Tepidisphaerales bacterium]
MPCVLACAGLIFPRVVMVVLLVATDWFGRAFQTWYWPLLGFLFMPYTTLGYLIAMIFGGGVTGGYVVLIVIAVLLDLGTHSGGGRAAVRGGAAVAPRS